MSIICMPEKSQLNYDDIEAALEFFRSSSEHILLQVPFHKDIVEVKRYVVKSMGIPDNNLGHLFTYGGRSIQFSLIGELEATFVSFYIGIS